MSYHISCFPNIIGTDCGLCTFWQRTWGLFGHIHVSFVQAPGNEEGKQYRPKQCSHAQKLTFSGKFVLYGVHLHMAALKIATIDRVLRYLVLLKVWIMLSIIGGVPLRNVIWFVWKKNDSLPRGSKQPGWRSDLGKETQARAPRLCERTPRSWMPSNRAYAKTPRCRHAAAMGNPTSASPPVCLRGKGVARAIARREWARELDSHPLD